ncbi:hypothetical protein QVD17_20017 [Tagetes erecta]|uniref:Uncharacterized protein n=1 Tax=Tagetes erecta TaxID=13708 RepID=A0AAD8NXH5_TARER|nr:hypothetical protein QVD17_20017 [Tagetes erecta]
MFDPMEVFGFSDEDLKILCENPIRVGAGADTRKEAALFERVANRARGIQAEVKELTEKIQKQAELNEDVRELTEMFEAAKAGAEEGDPTGFCDTACDTIVSHAACPCLAIRQCRGCDTACDTMICIYSFV